VSLRFRLAAVMAVAVFAAFLVAAGVAFIATQRILDDSLDRDLLATAVAVAEFPDVVRYSRALGPSIGALIGADTIVQVLTVTGSIATPPGMEFTRTVTGAELATLGDPTRVVRQDLEVDGVTFRTITLGTESGAVRVARSTAENDAVIAMLRANLVRFGIIAAGIAAAVGATVAARISKPVTELTDVAEAIAETGNLDRRIEADGDDEIGRLALAFNRMIGALSTSRDQQQRLVMDASHELRTPLTSLRTNLEVLQRAKGLDDDQRATLFGDVNAEVVELSELVGELVELATDQHTAEVAERLRLDEVTLAAVERIRRRYGREVVTDLAPSRMVGRPAMLERAVGNLLENAHKWNPPGAPLRVQLAHGVLSVHDRGPGIPEGERSKVFDRFYRTTDARTMNGSGLGLAIVKQIVEAHGGSVFALDSPDGGAAVGFRLPGVTEVEVT
jgi:two-component system, OmpR family, sensor histidine kinase MprB